MSDLIDRESLDKALTIAAANDKEKNRRTWAKAICVLHDAPAVDAAPVVHGALVNNGIHGSVLCRCSECHYDAAAYSFRYCPMCGAKMDGEGKAK